MRAVFIILERAAERASPYLQSEGGIKLGLKFNLVQIWILLLTQFEARKLNPSFKADKT